MITAENLLANYKVVHGDPANVHGLMTAVDLHRHSGGGGDTTATRWQVFSTLARQGVDVAITNHNQLGHAAASRSRDLLHRVTGKFVDIYDGVELTAKSHLSGRDVHVLVYKAPKPRKLKAFAPLPQLLAQIADQGGFAFLAHPELGENMSVTQAEVEDLAERGLPFGIEAHNGGAAQIEAWLPMVDARTNNPLFSFIRKRLPQSGSNGRAKEMAVTYEVPVSGGTDLHGGGKSFVLTCAPAGIPLFEAITTGRSVIVESKVIPKPQAHELVLGTIGSRFSSWRMDRRVTRLQRGLATA